MGNLQLRTTTFYNDVREIVLNARNNAVRSVEFARLMMYWHLGERIFVEEQRGQDRADYGEYLIRDLSKELEAEFGSGFSKRQLERARRFYFDRFEKLPDENPTVGILLCAAKNDTLVKITLPEDNTNILTSQYQLYIQSEESLLGEIRGVLELAEGGAVDG